MSKLMLQINYFSFSRGFNVATERALKKLDYVILPILFQTLINNTICTERGGSVVTHETRNREVPDSNPVADQPG